MLHLTTQGVLLLSDCEWVDVSDRSRVSGALLNKNIFTRFWISKTRTSTTSRHVRTREKGNTGCLYYHEDRGEMHIGRRPKMQEHARKGNIKWTR